MSLQHVHSAAPAVLDPGSCQLGTGGAAGTFRGYPVVIEYSPARGGKRARSAMVIAEVHGPTGGVQFDVSVVALLPDPEHQITGDPAFDGRYDVYGAPMVVLRWLFADPDLRARMLAVPTSFFDLAPERLRLSLPTSLDTDTLRQYLDIACIVFERLPAAVHNSGALAATGGRSLAFHPEVQARTQRRTRMRVLVFTLLGLLIGLPLLVTLLVLVAALAC